MANLQTFNAFGLIKVQSNKITGIITFASEGKTMMSRKISDETVKIAGLAQGKECLITFAVNLQPGKSPIVVQNFETSPAFKPSASKEVKNAIAKLIDIAAKAAKIE